MRKTIMIGDVPVALKATAATRYKYEAQFGRKLMKDLNLALGELKSVESSDDKSVDAAYDTINRLLYTMAKQANPSIPDDMVEWLDEFDSFPYEDFANDVITFWYSSMQTTVAPKNV